jgi:protein-tyrosine phosphatase
MELLKKIFQRAPAEVRIPMTEHGKIKVLFVCTGNICRSPTAEAVVRRVAEMRGLARDIYVDSAGTSDYHEGYPADRRAVSLGEQRGYDLSASRARQVRAQDFADFDHILAMDRKNLDALKAICPPEDAGKLRLFMEFSTSFQGADVPDPYFGNAKGFEVVLKMVEEAAEGLVEHLFGKLPKSRGGE